MRILVTGSTGFIGSALVAALRGRGDEVYPVVRRPPGPGEVGIDLPGRRLDAARLEGKSLEGIDAAVHLAGAPITTRWTPKHLENIRSSRVAVGDLLARSLAVLERPPAVLVSGSAVGVYGDRGDEVLDEQSSPGTGVLADICRSWEACTAPAAERGIRVVLVRTGIVLGGPDSAEGGILAAELPLFKLGLGARLGDGRQWTSWVALDDEIAVLIRAIDDSGLSGAVNSTSPNPVRNAELTDAIASAVGRRSRLFVPSPALRLGLGRGAADELLLASQRALPRRLLEAGYSHLRCARRRLSAEVTRLSVEVGAVTPHVVVDGVVRVDRLARVPPEALEDVVCDETLGDVVVIHVGYLELAAARGLQRRDHVEDTGVVQVDARDAIGARRLLGLLDYPQDLSRVVELRHPEVAKMLLVRDLGQQQARALALIAETLHGRSE
jgi:uncharacterized protein (TIGR01777 family)